MSISPHNQRLRQSDEKILEWVRLRSGGMSCRDIAARWDATEGYVRVATHEAMTDDIALSGEPPGIVRCHYWQEA